MATKLFLSELEDFSAKTSLPAACLPVGRVGRENKQNDLSRNIITVKIILRGLTKY